MIIDKKIYFFPIRTSFRILYDAYFLYIIKYDTKYNMKKMVKIFSYTLVIILLPVINTIIAQILCLTGNNIQFSTIIRNNKALMR